MPLLNRRIYKLLNAEYDDDFDPIITRPMPFFRMTSTGSSERCPVINVYETDEAWVIHAECPGVCKEDIEIDLTRNTLTLSGETKFNTEYAMEDLRYRECPEGTFTRCFSIPDNVDCDKITAKYKNGIVKLLMPKIPPSPNRDRRIPVQ